MEYFSFGEMMPTLLCLRQQLLKVEVNEDKRLEMDVKMFVRRKNEVVGKLDLAVEVLTTAFGVELDDIVLQNHFCFLMLVMVPQAMHACCGSVTEATRHVMIFGAIMELHIPSDRDKQHRKGHQKGTDLQKPLFHGAKICFFPLKMD
jgi:hypothetical protein